MTDVQPEVQEESEPAVAATPDPPTVPVGPAEPEPVEAVEQPATPQATPDPALPSPAFPVFRVMNVDEVSLDLPSQYPAVTLVESEPPMRMLVFPVGLPEGTAMAQALRRMESRRPMTHELFMQVLQRARIDVIAVRLTGRDEGTLLAELDLMTPGGRQRIDCRPSDGLVLALRMPVPAPILIDERLLEEAGDVVPIRDDEGTPLPDGSTGP
jgi:bifunctional DNase/RNase